MIFYLENNISEKEITMYFEKLLGVNEIPVGAKIIYREAVRGVVLNDRNLAFMIHTVKGDYKFPGGGIEAGENHLSALTREFIEETGYTILDTIKPIGVIIEQKQDIYEANAYFVMKSYYYGCEIIGENLGQNLDAYEKEMDFKAKYVPISEAYKQNRQLLESSVADINSWVEREVIALESIIKRLNIQL